MKKRLLALLLALVLAAGVLPAHAGAAESTQKLAAITFDDGPGKYTDGLLDELAKRDVVVTFFMQGYNVEKYPEVVKKAYEAGHQIASHTYNHPQLTTLSDAKVKEQLAAAAGALDRAIGVSNSYMLRPPYGSVNDRVLAAIGTPAVLWSVDTLDWKSRNADAVYNHIVNDTRDGSIVLLHDLYATSVAGALRGIDALLEQGYELVTVEELLRRRGSEAAAGKKYFSAPGATTLPGIAAPAITPQETADGYLVSLSADEGAVIYYTTDGTAPTSQSTVYTDPFPIQDAATVKAFAAYNLNGARSRVAEAALETPRAEPPAITLEDGMAVISAAGAVYYTLDGSAPTADSARYSSLVPLEAGTVIRAVAVQPDRRVSLVSSLLHSELGSLFTDVLPEDWYYHDVDKAVAQGLMAAANHAFSPEEAATRREVVTVLYRLAGQPSSGGNISLTDVAADDPVRDAAAWAVEQHILSGFDDGTLRPDEAVTREQLAVMLWRMFGEDGEPVQTPPTQFSDWESVADYARNAAAWAAARKLMSGVSEALFAPGAVVTRAQLAGVALRCQDAFGL